ncbi:MAG: type II toxin-antitoxin system VapC family toxin [Actinobacteria bacterium]|nr:type II toxin-antitoxin system VapC family toxin [Actinomycetota bacterium]NBO07604.1 type II toxin-antitoxin system VapC family toxin [Actinomycetota bacterium]NBO47708.1 type II toxin-antitoxin system VapC family toxin [Actinomycetota bacterium]NBP22564.1 type II toxin-antitoxin system VapC family toxin [Actinomycetota bacterium]NBQ01102.1 type II toxin-antitoxin system VapC family toxin [Actinomycetota bacterium]
MGRKSHADTSWLIALLNPDDISHKLALRQLEELNAPASISTFVLAELMVSFEKSDIGSIPATLQEIEKSFSPIVVLSKEIAIRAAKIRSSSKITLGDAIVIASAIDQNSDLLTFDKNMKAVYERNK